MDLRKAAAAVAAQGTRTYLFHTYDNDWTVAEVEDSRLAEVEAELERAYGAAGYHFEEATPATGADLLERARDFAGGE